MSKEQEQLKINQEIQRQESKADHLRNESHKVQETFDNLQSNLRRGYLELTHLNQEISHFGGKESVIIQQKDEEQALFFRRQLGKLQEDFHQEYNKQTKLIANEKEALQRKRSELV